MKTTEFGFKNAEKFFTPEELRIEEQNAARAKETLLCGSGAGSDFIGWTDLPVMYDKEEFERIKKAAKKIRTDSDVLVVIGIGGSYLGARAAIEFLTDTFGRGGTEIYFAGNSISSKYIYSLINAIGDRDFSVNVISKSGTTTEPAIAFRIFREMLTDKYGEAGAAERIYATTDSKKGALKALADKNGYETFTVPDNVGGRYSVLTAVGLLPIAAAGCDIDALMRGAADMREKCVAKEAGCDPASEYAAVRSLLHKKGKKIELCTNFEPSMHYIGEWWKQLFGESEGKEHKGIFPATADFTTDLHSMGQYIQDGERILMETVLEIKNCAHEIMIKEESGDPDGLNYLAGKPMSFVNERAMNGTVLAHEEGGVPCMRVVIDSQNEYSLGSLFYFFEFACGISGYMLGVNPFDQPGVESYKKNMFALLDKPGYEELSESLKKRL